MPWGFGFLSPDHKKPYLERAQEQIISEEEAEEQRCENGQFGVGA